MEQEEGIVMAANKKPRHKPHQARWNGDGIKLKAQPWKVAAVFNPLEAILDQLEQQGTIDATPAVVAIFKDAIDGHWYESSVALMGVVDAYEIHERRTGRKIDLAALAQLANKLKYDMPIFSDDTQACRACLARMKAETVQMTAGYAKQLITDFQLMEELQKVTAV
jgi:hypothetical protein